MQIAILLFDGMTALDAVGPYEVLHRIPGAEVKMVAEAPGPVRTANQDLALHADYALADVHHTDVLVVPGGDGTRDLMNHRPTLDWIRSINKTSQWTTSVCTGSLVLGGAGLLQGVQATTHWLAFGTLEATGAIPTNRRVVERGKIMTSAGVSAGIDMALRLAARLGGEVVAQSIQLAIEYDPDPPFDTGSTAKASDDLIELVRNVAKQSGLNVDSPLEAYKQ